MLLYKQTERLIFLFKSRKRENAAKVKCSALQSKAESTSRAELSGADDVNKRREGRENQKSSFRPGRVLLLGLPPLPCLVDVIGARYLGSWCGLSLRV